MRQTVLYRTLLVAAWLGSAFAVLQSTVVQAAPDGSRWGANYFPNFPVVTQHGETLRFYDDLIKDKMVVINFIYTRCPDICPLSTARLAEVQKRLGDRVGRDVFFYSISLDPKNDTPDVLKAYAEAFDARPGWLFVTGDAKDLHTIRYKLGERSRSLSEHRSFIVLANDATGEWSRNSLMANLDRLASDVRKLDPKWRNRKRALPKERFKKRPRSRYILSKQPGEALFLKACAACHSIGKGDRVGPDLMDVTQRRERDWLVRFMMRPDRMRAQKDPISVALDKKYKGVRMPNLGLSENDAADLIAYFEHRTKAVKKQRSASVDN